MGLYSLIHLLRLYDLCLHVRRDPSQLTATSKPALLFLKSLSILWDRPRAWGDVRGGGRPSCFIVSAWLSAVGKPSLSSAMHCTGGGSGGTRALLSMQLCSLHARIRGPWLQADRWSLQDNRNGGGLEQPLRIQF